MRREQPALFCFVALDRDGANKSSAPEARSAMTLSVEIQLIGWNFDTCTKYPWWTHYCDIDIRFHSATQF